MVNKPEKLVVHELFLIFGPIISELGNLEVEASDGVRTQQQCGALSGSQTKVLLEEIHCHLTSSNRIRVALFSGCFISPKARDRRLTI